GGPEGRRRNARAGGRARHHDDHRRRDGDGRCPVDDLGDLPRRLRVVGVLHRLPRGGGPGDAGRGRALLPLRPPPERGLHRSRELHVHGPPGHVGDRRPFRSHLDHVHGQRVDPRLRGHAARGDVRTGRPDRRPRRAPGRGPRRPDAVDGALRAAPALAGAGVPSGMPRARDPGGKSLWFFAFFLISGFCGLIYEVVWLRLAMASFGVTTPLVSIFLSVFMGGLALGSWLVGRLTRRLGAGPVAPLRLYALTELLIALSGLVVPDELEWGRRLLGELGTGISWASSAYYLVSGAWIALTLLPFGACMGATFPLAICAIGRSVRADARRSFSYLYFANVLGAA